MKEVETLQDGEFFGTDIASFGSDERGIFIIEGSLYPISKEQFSQDSGDITRTDALKIINIKDS